MKKSILCILLFQLTIQAFSQIKEESFFGKWNGELKTSMGTADVLLEVEKNEDQIVAWITSLVSGINKSVLQEVKIENNTFFFKFNLAQATYSGKIDNKKISGFWSQRGQHLPLDLFRKEDFIPSLKLEKRKQTPVKPYAYLEEEIQFKNNLDGTKLAGTLTLPKGKGLFPAVILLTVAGANDRDQSHSMGHKPFMVLADYLTRQGIAVLRYDDRGVGGSEGSIYTAGFEDFTNDALAAFTFLESRDEIDKSKIGFIGNSEGTVIGPMSANKNKSVAFTILLGGVGKPLHILTADRLNKMNSFYNVNNLQKEEIIRYMSDVSRILKNEEDNIKAQEKLLKLNAKNTFDKEGFPNRLFFMPNQKEKRIELFTSPWYRSQATFDPELILSKVTCPVLAITGSLDPFQSPDLNLPAIYQYLIKSGNDDITIVKIPKVNHVMQTAKTGLITEYPLLEESFSPKVMKVISNWLELRFKN